MVYIGPNDETTKGHTMDEREHMENGHGWGFPPDTTDDEIATLHEQDHQRPADRTPESWGMDEHLADHAEMNYGSREVLFQPFVHVFVKADGSREIRWDWTDTLQGEVDPDGGPIDHDSPLAEETAEWMDDQRRAGALPGDPPPPRI